MTDRVLISSRVQRNDGKRRYHTGDCHRAPDEDDGYRVSLDKLNGDWAECRLCQGNVDKTGRTGTQGATLLTSATPEDVGLSPVEGGE